MPLVRDSLQMIFLPAQLDDRWTDRQVNDFKEKCIERSWTDNERCGLRKSAIVSGGFTRYWFEHSERLRLYANHQGGYRVFCPKCSHNLARTFASAVQKWRAGGARALKCIECSAHLGLEKCVLKPYGGFAHAALIFAGVSEAQISSSAQQLILDVLGETRLVFKRMG